jgi:large subunit ribosomal protein L17
VFSYLQNKESLKELFGSVASKIAERAGGYTRIIKMGDVRLGDNAEMCLIELVDFNTLYSKDEKAGKATKTRRSRRSTGKKTEGEQGAEETTATVEKNEKPAKKAPAKKTVAKKKKED